MDVLCVKQTESQCPKSVLYGNNNHTTWIQDICFKKFYYSLNFNCTTQISKYKNEPVADNLDGDTEEADP